MRDPPDRIDGEMQNGAYVLPAAKIGREALLLSGVRARVRRRFRRGIYLHCFPDATPPTPDEDIDDGVGIFLAVPPFMDIA